MPVQLFRILILPPLNLNPVGLLLTFPLKKMSQI